MVVDWFSLFSLDVLSYDLGFIVLEFWKEDWVNLNRLSITRLIC